MNLKKRIEAVLLDGQHGHPRGIIGRMLGERMIRQHMPETTWTISLLDIHPEDQVLELGFGAGRAIELVAAQATNGHVSGLDHSQEMVRAANRRNARAIKGHVTLYQGNLHSSLRRQPVRQNLQYSNPVFLVRPGANSRQISLAYSNQVACSL